MASRAWRLFILLSLLLVTLPAATAAVPAQPPRTQSSPSVAGPAAPEPVRVTLPPGPASPPAGSAVASGPYRPRGAGTYTLQGGGGTHNVDVLLVEADYDIPGDCPIRTLLQGYGDLGSIDLYDAQSGTPSLSDLLAYPVVLVWSDFPFQDPVAMGDVLADYVDAGGRVIDLEFALDPDWGYQGRFRTAGYSAMTTTGYTYDTQCLGSYDPSHPIMAGVTNVCEYYRGIGTALTVGASAVASWSDGELFVAAKDNRSVATINAYVGDNYQWTGQMADVVHNAIRWLTLPAILHITTTDTGGSVELALQQLGYSYDLVAGDDWTGIDFASYDIVIVGMDGGYVESASIQKLRTDVIDAGKKLFFLGGTCYGPFATAVNTYLVLNDTGDYCWVVSGTPQWTVTDPSHPLAFALPSPYDYATNAAGYYQARVNDPGIEQVAVNGDGYPAFFHKAVFAGQETSPGDFTWYIDSVNASYWADPADFAFLKQLIGNVIGRRTFTYAPFVAQKLRPLSHAADGDSLPHYDQDVYSFTATPGTILTVGVDTVSLDTAFDIEACLSTEDGASACIAYGDDQVACTYPPPDYGCPRFTATLPADGDGVYYLLIESGSDYDNYAGPVGLYHAQVSALGTMSALSLVHDNQPGTFLGK